MLVTVLLSLLQVACGGGGGGDSGTAPPVASTPANLQALTVGPGPGNGINHVYTSVVVCTPGDTASCRTIDRILVDTGSVGLRLLASVVPVSLRLAQRTTGSAALVECTQFADGFSWGPVKTADIRLGGETLRSVAIQVIGDPAYAAVPADCSATGTAENSVDTFGSNGVLGVGNFADDCGDICARSTAAGVYYACTAFGCNGTTVPQAQQLQHPATLMVTHNNGVIVRLPGVDADGAVGVTGSLVFGIGTETNNGLGAARVYTVDPFTGTLPVTANGITFAASFVDSGSNATFFPSTLPPCSRAFYCPASPQTISALLQGLNGNNTAFSFTVANADALFRDHPTFGILPKLAGPAFGANAVDLGLPFFFGRSVYTAIEARQTPGGVGPYIAF
ncbi:MAG: DUF3443 family protein [Herminiimonas sp.]|nr:DUF3443 family protein [Herminiimonas sp.]